MARNPYDRYGLPGDPNIVEAFGPHGFSQGTVYTRPEAGTNVPVAEVQGIPPEAAAYQAAQPVDPYARPYEMVQGRTVSTEYPVSSANMPLPPGRKYRYIDNDAAANSGFSDDLLKEYDTYRMTGIPQQQAMAVISAKKQAQMEAMLRFQSAMARANKTKEVKPNYSKFKNEIGKLDKMGYPVYNDLQSILNLGKQYNIPKEEIPGMTGRDKWLKATWADAAGQAVSSPPLQPAPATPVSPAQPAPEAKLPPPLRQDGTPMSVEEYVAALRPHNPQYTDQEIADNYYMTYRTE